jgi:hypothetical protein
MYMRADCTLTMRRFAGEGRPVMMLIGKRRVRSANWLLTICVAVAFSVTAKASFHTFQIHELYSSADGSVQFIELKEAFSADGQQFLTGHTLTSSQGSTVRTFTFPVDLPSSLTASKSVLIATPGFAGLAGVTPDYTIPTPFLFPGGGTIDYAGVDSVTYAALPTDGVTSVDRNGAPAANTPTNFAGETGALAPPAPPSTPAIGVPTLGAMGLTFAIVLVVLIASFAWRPGARKR